MGSDYLRLLAFEALRRLAAAVAILAVLTLAAQALAG